MGLSFNGIVILQLYSVGTCCLAESYAGRDRRHFGNIYLARSGKRFQGRVNIVQLH